jgi:hypothetical protein
MTFLIHIATTRHVDTLSEEIDGLRRQIASHSRYQWRSRDDMDPFYGDDQLLFGLDADTGLYPLKGFLAEALDAPFITSWSITEVGTGISFAHREIDRETNIIDDRFLYFDDDERFYYGDVDQVQVDQNKAALASGFSRLRWRLNYDVKGATVLWVDLTHEIEVGRRDRMVTTIHQLLPRPAKIFWKGRSSVAFGYVASHHDLRRSSPFGITEELQKLLDDEDITGDWLAFELGTQTVGKAGELLNEVNGIINDLHRRRPPPRLPSTSRTKSQPKDRKEVHRPVVVVQKSRPRR